MGRGITPNSAGARCQGKDGAGSCPFPDATCKMNRKGPNGVIFWKKLCSGCFRGKQPPAPRPAPQPRSAQPPQLNAFGGLASTVSIGRGNPGKRTKWDGTVRCRYCEDMTFLISIYLCLVTSSVCCETGFSRWLSSPLTLCMLVEYR